MEKMNTTNTMNNDNMDSKMKKDSAMDTTETVRGELTYEDKVIQKIIGIAIAEVDGLLTVDGGFFSNIKDKIVNSDDVTTGIETEVGKKQVAVDMDIVAEYGKDIEEIFENIKKVIAREVKAMTHLEVIEVNVNVVDIKTRQQFEEDSETYQDKLGSAAEATGDFTSKQADKAKSAFAKGRDKIEDNSEPRVR